MNSSIGGNKIKDIVDNQGKYSGTEVTVSGKVIGETALGYMINDGTANISVISGTIPAMDEEISVNGIVGVSPFGDVFIDTRLKK